MTGWRTLARLAPKIAWRARRALRLTSPLRPLRADFSMAVPFAYPVGAASAGPPRIAVVCHLFHVALADEILATLRNVPAPSDLFVTTDTQEKRRRVVEVFRGWTGAVDVRVIPNRGRDAAGKFVVFRDVARTHDYVLYLHSKQDTHFQDGSAWRRFLFETLAGSPAIVASVLDAFDHNPDLGIVFAQHWRPIRACIGWTENYPHVRQLGRRLGLDLRPRDPVEFPSGSMFWARGAALRPILDLDLTLADFPAELLPDDGTMLHALERLVLFCCEAAGFRWAKIARPDLPGYPSSIVPIRSPADISGFLAEHAFRLLRRPPMSGVLPPL